MPETCPYNGTSEKVEVDLDPEDERWKFMVSREVDAGYQKQKQKRRGPEEEGIVTRDEGK